MLMVLGHKVSVEDFEAEALPHLDDLYRAASRLMGDRTEAEDMVQEVYLQAWKSFDRFQLGTNCRAWLFKIMFNKVHHYYRSRYNSKMVKEADEFLNEVAAYEPPAPEHISDREILDALGRLPHEYREVILLADVQEFSYKEIAEILSIPIGTVMSRISRGRKLLRIELADVARLYGVNDVKKERRQL